MEDGVFRGILLALGSCVIIAVLVHGIWVSRKNSNKKRERSVGNQKNRKPQLQPGGWRDQEKHSSNTALDIDIDEEERKFRFQDDDVDKQVKARRDAELDDLGLGAVRVVNTHSAKANPNPSKVSTPEMDEMPSLADFEPSKEPVQPEAKPVSTGKVYASVVSQPKPEYVAKYGHHSATVKNNNPAKPMSERQVPEPPPFLLKKENEVPEVSQQRSVDIEALKQSAAVAPQEAFREASTKQIPEQPVAEKLSLAEQARQLVMGKKTEHANNQRREPQLTEEQMHIDFDDKMPKDTEISPPVPKPEPPKAVAEIQQEVLVLNVKSAEDTPIQGAALLPMLLTLGFKFGDQDIFHRHVNANGKGPVLFSLANMFKPGNFDIDNLENFTTQGLSLFMILPIEGDPHQVFNMMHNAARKLADEFSAQVYDGRRAQLSKQSLQQYVEKIREFERKRMASR